MAMTNVGNQAVWYRSFLMELGYFIDDPIPIHGNNKGAINLTENPVTRCRSKHINIRHHVICQYKEDKKISLVRMPTTQMVADGFTKSLSCTLLQQFNSGMGLSDL